MSPIVLWFQTGGKTIFMPINMVIIGVKSASEKFARGIDL
jgi:hypothetical protein